MVKKVCGKNKKANTCIRKQAMRIKYDREIQKKQDKRSKS